MKRTPDLIKAARRRQSVVLLITASFLLLAACPLTRAAQADGNTPVVKRTPEAARRELAQLNLEYSPEAFVKAAGDGDWMAVPLYLDAGMDVNRPNTNGVTARWMAEKMAQKEVVAMLRKAGGRQSFYADLVCDLIGENPDNFPRRESGFQEIPFTRLVQTHRESINDLSSQWITPLCAAVHRRNPTAVRILLTKGADANLKVDFRIALGGRYASDLNGEYTPLAFAEWRANLIGVEYKETSVESVDAQAIVRILKEAGSADTANEAGPNPILADSAVRSLRAALINMDLDAVRRATRVLVEQKVKAEGISPANALAAIKKEYIDPLAESLRATAAGKVLSYQEGGAPASAEMEDDLSKLNTALDQDLANKEVGAPDRKDRTALMVAANATIAKALIERGAKLDEVDNAGCTPLIWAAYNGRPDVVNLLLERGANISAKTTNGMTALMYAKDATIAKALIELGAKLDEADNAGWTPLMAAAYNGHTDVVNLLLERRANISAKSTNGRTALMVAANAAITKALIERGARLEEVDNAGRTPLMAAAAQGNTDVVTLLLSNGAKLDAGDTNGMTAMMYAGSAAVADLLLGKGAKIDEVSHQRGTPLSAAAAGDHADVVRLLLTRGAKIDAPNIYGRTPLMLAAGEGGTNAVRVLLGKGADVSVVDKDRMTALAHAMSKGHIGIVAMLKQAGAKR